MGTPILSIGSGAWELYRLGHSSQAYIVSNMCTGGPGHTRPRASWPRGNLSVKRTSVHWDEIYVLETKAHGKPGRVVRSHKVHEASSKRLQSTMTAVPRLLWLLTRDGWTKRESETSWLF